MQRIPFNLLTNVRSIPTLQQVLVSRAMGDWRASNKGCSSRSFTPSVSHRDTPSKHRSSPSKHRSSSKMGSSGDATRKQAEEEDRKAASLAALESSSVSAQEPAASYSASISSPLPPEYLHIPQPTSKPSAPSSSPPPRAAGGSSWAAPYTRSRSGPGSRPTTSLVCSARTGWGGWRGPGLCRRRMPLSRTGLHCSRKRRT